MQKMVTCLWFSNQAEEAANYYVGIFDNASLGRITRYPDEGKEVHGGEPGSVLTVEFEVNGMSFMALNGGDVGFKFDESVSFVVYCDTQEEIDKYWEALTADGGAESQCGWLKDKYGVSWQITPPMLDEYIASEDPEIANKAMRAMLKMQKIVIADIEAAVKS